MAWWTTERVAATAAATGAMSAVVAAISAVRTLRQNRRDSKARNRPMVAAELRAHPHSDGTQLLVVRNFGPSIARDVRVSFDPEIPDPPDPARSGIPYLKKRYADAIPVLTPGMELDNIYQFRGQGGDVAPGQSLVTIRYASDSGDRYSDEFPLDVELLKNRTYVTTSSSPEAQVKEIAKALKGMHRLAKNAEMRQHRMAVQPVSEEPSARRRSLLPWLGRRP